MSQHVEIIAGETAFSVVWQGREYLIVTVDPETNVLCVSAPLFDEINWADSLETMPTPPLDVSFRGRRDPATPLELTKTADRDRNQIATVGRVTAIRPSRRQRTAPRATAASGTLTPLEELQRDQVLTLVIASWKEHPNQTTDFTRSETHRIAQEVFGDNEHTSVMRVAGVRAALSRGAYDDTLLGGLGADKATIKRMTS